jgi:hypothetical protein
MKPFTRHLALLVFSAFLSFSILGSFHGHPSVLTPQDCSICKVAHQTPGLLSAPEAAAPALLSIAARHAKVSQPPLLFVFTSHGLSPPAA